ncbi:DNA primase [Methanobacterium sp.]|uniref:DNA primase n=1 Tax=Methanobacterium sp. TaxID=2164 RepID=UPI0025EDC322|nr:DNA primase [Methanobacterium sp.]MBI5459827.1 DNA primase [Methanobacterium sp.]
MVSISFLNPLSPEGKDIVRELGSFEGISDDIPELRRLVTRNPSQEIVDDKEIPSNYLELALKRIEWYIKKKHDREFNSRRYSFLSDYSITKYDVISFYLLCQAIGVKFGPNSRETRVMVEAQGDLIQERMGKLSIQESRLMVDQSLAMLLHDDMVHWTFFQELLSTRKIRLTELVLDNGELILNEEDFLHRFGSRIKHRNPDSMYQLLIGDELKELIMVKMIMQETEDYIKQVHEKARVMVEPNPILLELADEVAEVLAEPMQHYGYGSGRSGGPMKAGPLNPLAFPPCVKKALEGIKSGGRNDAIVLFMTPFVSYARLYPDVFRMNITKRVSDQDPQLQITENEVLPLIYEAAQRCVPPLFDDQPQEKVNINAKLGFGMHSTLKMEHEGETTWYTPMSCEKIKLHLPHLCRPDDVCKKIGNPLSYYNRRIWEVMNLDKEDSDSEDNPSSNNVDNIQNSDIQNSDIENSANNENKNSDDSNSGEG